MKREEAEKLASYWANQDNRISAHRLILLDSIDQLLPLARLGASVAEPSEEEIEAMARAGLPLSWPNSVHTFENGRPVVKMRPAWEDQKQLQGVIRAALAALKERAHG